MLTDGEGKEGEEQDEVTGYLGAVLALQEATGGVLSVVAVARRPWWRRAVVLRQWRASRVGLGSFSATRGIRSGAWLGRGMARGEGAAVSFRWWLKKCLTQLNSFIAWRATYIDYRLDETDFRRWKANQR